MKIMLFRNKFLYLFVFYFLFPKSAWTQFDISGQIIQRSEFRNGFGQLIAKDADPAAFISHRARLQFKYQFDRLTIYTSVQDIRTFGNTSQVKLSDPFLSVHEAWTEIKLDTSFLTLKVGRQELNYDNARFLGNLDWALQARSHDFVLLKYEKDKIKFHLGGGYNQDSEKLSGNIFTIANQYKTAQMIWAAFQDKKYNVSFLIWNDGRQYMIKDTLDVITSKGVRFMPTIGLPTLKVQFKNTTLSGFYYHQLGKDVTGRNKNAFDVNFQIAQVIQFNETQKNQLLFSIGTEILSGTNSKKKTGDNKSFSPLYGTNHMHNGYMDYFYVGGRGENGMGLYDSYLRIKYSINSKSFFSVNAHWFNSQADVYNAGNEKLDAYLGTEIDFTFGYVFFKAFSIQAGYSQMFENNTLKNIQGIGNAKSTQNWGYLMLIYRPNSNKKFIGLSF